MKRVMYALLAVALCLGTAQLILAQVRPIEDCVDCCSWCQPTPEPTPCSNPIDDPTFFVQQQYRDFLFREPTGYELANDVAPLNSCLHAGDFACYNTARVHMSRSMWDRPEFRQQSRTFGLPLYPDPNLPYELYNNDHFVSLEYWIYLQRAPDSAGEQFWLGSLNNCVANSTSHYDCPGCSTQCYNDSINAFLQSTEYRARFGCT